MSFPCLPIEFGTWACRSVNEQFGNLDAYGCEVGCLVCNDYPDQLIRLCMASRGGKRWLSPHQTIQSRDARGELVQVQSHTPHRISNVMTYELAPCFSYTGKECHSANYCDCYPSESPFSQNNRCECGEAVGRRLTGLHRDCTLFLGYSWPLNTNTLRCRLTTEGGAIPFQVGSGRLFQAAFVRTGDNCISNILIPFMAKVPNSSCESAYIHVHDRSNPPLPPPDYYEDGPRCRNFKYARLYFYGENLPEANNPHLVDSPLFKTDPKILAAKNAALNGIIARPIAFPNPAAGGTGVLRFDSINSVAIDANTNSDLDVWKREWSGAELPIEDLPAVMSMPNCRLKNSGVRVYVDLVYERVSVEASLVALLERQDDNAESAQQQSQSPLWLLPSVRMRIVANLALRARTVGDATYRRPWKPEAERNVTLSINHRHSDAGGRDELGRRLPYVDPPIDEIVYVHPDGEQWQPPLDVQWLGMQGAFSDPPWHNVFMEPPSGVRVRGLLDGPFRTVSRFVADSLSYSNRRGVYDGLRVTGWPWMSDTSMSTPAQVYGGGVGMYFPTGGGPFNLCR